MILSAALVGAAIVPSAQAFTYADGDVLLAFRETGYNDVVFNLGSVSQFLGLTSGTVKAVTNWNVALTTANFGDTLDGASFAVLAVSAPQATASRSWLSDSDPVGIPTHVTYSKWSTQHGAAAGVGKDAVAMLSATNTAYVRDPGSSHSYTYIVGGGGSYDVTTLGGSSTFPVEADILGDGATVRFFEIKADNTPAIPQQIGSFSITAAGTLTFTAGSSAVPPTITTPPVSQTVNLGTPVNFSVVASGTAPFSYQWQRNGANLSGKTADTLSLASATAADAGDYTVVVSNLGGSATNSPAATLLVRVPATVTGGTWRNGQFTAPVQTLSGLTYTLVYRNAITDAAWTPILPATPGTGGIVNLIDPSATAAARFYRVLTQ